MWVSVCNIHAGKLKFTNLSRLEPWHTCDLKLQTAAAFDVPVNHKKLSDMLLSPCV
jgi:hypothetical protein